MAFDPARTCELSASQARNGSAMPKGNGSNPAKPILTVVMLVGQKRGGGSSCDECPAAPDPQIRFHRDWPSDYGEHY